MLSGYSCLKALKEGKVKLLKYIIVFSIAAAMVYLGGPLVEAAATWLNASVTNERPPASWGIAASFVSSIIAYAYIYFSQNWRKKPGYIRRYRWAEQTLAGMGRMTRDEILQYHGSYNWHAYAGLGFTTLFIIVPLFITGQLKVTDPLDELAIFLGLGLLGASTVILGMTDLFHTNTLTPLITSDRRFALMDIIIKLGGGALALQVCAVGIFLSLINSWLSIMTSALTLWLTIFITERRGVPIASLQKERELTDEQARQVENS